jgi:hypothetical protein
VILDRHIANNTNSREVAVLDGTVREEAGADGQERNAKGPGIFKGGLDAEELLSTNKPVSEIGTPVEGEKTVDQAADPLPEGGR